MTKKIDLISIKFYICTNTKMEEMTATMTIQKESPDVIHHGFTDITLDIIEKIYEQKIKRNIWGNSDWKHIADLENDDVGKCGEQIINKFCQMASIPSDIDGTKTKELGGGCGDGIINHKTVEIKTARLGSSGSSFQHELGEQPWNADFMLFLDISPDKMFITLFPNFTEEFYKKSGTECAKCEPYFPTKSITWRKNKGAFKLDTTMTINEKNKYTFTFDSTTTDFTTFQSFVNNIITPV